MDARWIGFILWALFGCGMIALGIRASALKRPAGFWANSPAPDVKDVPRYNRALGRLFMVYGAVFIVLGLPLLSAQNSPLILLSVLGVVFETIAAMTVYTLRIEAKYAKTDSDRFV